MSNLTTVQDMYDAFSKGDVPSILGHLADDVVWDMEQGPATFLGSSLGRAGKALQSSFPVSLTCDSSSSSRRPFWNRVRSSSSCWM